MSIAPFFGSHNTYHTLRRKATDSSKEIEIFLKMLLLTPAAQNMHRFALPLGVCRVNRASLQIILKCVIFFTEIYARNSTFFMRRGFL